MQASVHLMGLADWMRKGHENTGGPSRASGSGSGRSAAESREASAVFFSLLALGEVRWW